MTSSLRVLAYHRVIEPGDDSLPNPSLVSATPSVFAQQIAHLAARYRVVSLPEVLAAQRGQSALPKRAVLLTFDDGCRDFGEVVWPILKHYGMPATVFVPTAFPGNRQRVFWWERLHHAFGHTRRQVIDVPKLGALRLDSRAARSASLRAVQQLMKRIPHHVAMALVDQLCAKLDAGEVRESSVLSWPELRRLAAEGVSLAAHTQTHPALTQLDDEGVAAEVRGSLDDLQREIGSVLPVFCCPFGLYHDRVIDQVKRNGVELAFSCMDGHNTLPSADPLRLRRTLIMSRTTPSIFALRLLKAVSYVDMWRHRPGRVQDHVPDARVAQAPSGQPELKVAYIMSRFPKLSETFVLNEILTLEALGVNVELYPLLREHQPVSHPEAARLTRAAHFQPFVSPGILRAQLAFIRRKPAAYFRVLFEVLRKTWGSANFFMGTIGIFPKSVRFAYEMQKRGVTHVHSHFCSHPAAAALIINRLTGIPFSFTAHGSDLHVERRMLDTKVQAAAFAVTICDFNREVMVRECGEAMRNKIHVIHCGVDGDVFSPTRALRNGGPVEIICVASLEEVKGHRFLIDACRMLANRGLDFRCHLVGSGPMQRVLEQQIVQHGLQQRVHLLGGKPRSEVARLLSTASVAVLASHPTREGKREGLPVALMEAMAAGLPVVASNLSGIPELVEHEVTGLLIEPGDVEAIADALERLSRDEALRDRMGRAGVYKVAAEFSLQANTRQLLELFRDPAKHSMATRNVLTDALPV
jgi:colanic acid/amylovoran biosynthesis glycosyltransferase